MNWSFGSEYTSGDRAEFRVWHPYGERIELELIDSKKTVPMQLEDNGIWRAMTDVVNGERYMYNLGSSHFPDPTSHFQPEGVHGPSQIVDHSTFDWQNTGWKGRQLKEYVIYEVHVGTFGKHGTYRDVEGKIDHFRRLGITAIELMPVGQFPGSRNWGYDGVQIYAPQNSYGSVDDLKHLVDTLHGDGIDVILDVVYNHMGPEGNYLSKFGPYFTARYSTPWGDAINYDDSYSDTVRKFILENALYWLTEFRIDSLRLDAIHGIFDFSPKHILKEIEENVEKLARNSGRNINIIAESDLNDPVLIRGIENCGYGLAGQWNDDYHHALHAYITGEKKGYYQDFGDFEQIVKALNRGFVYDGIYSIYRKLTRGEPLDNMPLSKLIVYSQNHDQIGNRAEADRLITAVSLERSKAAASLVLLSPFTPLLFMGEEYGETSPFNYFIDTKDTKLARAVKEGRKREFRSFGMNYDKDPNDSALYNSSKLVFERSESVRGRELLNFYSSLISVRKKIGTRMDSCTVSAPGNRLIRISYGLDGDFEAYFSLSDEKIWMAGKKEKKRVIFRSDWKDFGGTMDHSEETLDHLEPFESVVFRL